MNEEVARLYADVGLKISGALRGLRDFRSRLRSSQGALKTLRDQSKITSTAINLGLTAGLTALGIKGIGALADIGVSMSVFKLATQATTEQMEKAREKIAELARDASLPKATLAASAEALAELGKAGLAADDAINALRPTMLLAAAGGLQAGDAARILSGALLAFHLPGTEAARIADLLAGAELRAAGSVKDHADALQQAGAVFALAGVPIEDLVTSIALMANAGILGSDAGTALKGMMLRLIAPTEEAAGMMRAMGVSVYDAEGKMKPFREVIKQFEKGLEPLTEAQKNQRLETIFGSDAIRAAAIIFGGKGVEAFDSMKGSITEVGLAQQLATAKTEGLGGAVENVSKALDTASVGAVKPFEEDIKNIARAVSGAILWFDGLDDGTKKIIISITGGILILGAIATMIGIVSTIAGTLATGIGILGVAVGFLVASPLALLILILGGLVAVLVWAYKTSETFRSVVDGAFAGVGSAAGAMWDRVRPIFDAIGGAIRQVIGWIGDLGRAWGLIPTSVPAPKIVNVGQPNLAPIPTQWQTPGMTGFVNGQPIPGRAAGGSVAAARPYMVGERGPELFVPGRSGTVVPGASGASTTSNANFYGPVFGFSDLKDHIARAMSELKAEGRI